MKIGRDLTLKDWAILEAGKIGGGGGGGGGWVTGRDCL